MFAPFEIIMDFIQIFRESSSTFLDLFYPKKITEHFSSSSVYYSRSIYPFVTYTDMISTSSSWKEE
jgi:hypothetical protein